MKFKITSFLVSMLVINLMLMACSENQTDNKAKETKVAKETKTATAAKEPETTEKVLPKMVDLGAKNCIPCKKMAPILDELDETYQGVFDVVFIDVWQPENRAAAQKYGIRVIPTQIYFDETGKELWRHEGFLSKEDILGKWAELGYDFKPKQ